jgi:MoxR-like ATPase
MDEASVNPKELTIERVQEILRSQQYVCDRSLATVVYLSLVMGKPLLLEGEAGVGKTEVAKVLARVLGTELVRLQCYEGIDVAQAVYEWSYARQMLHIRLLEARGEKPEEAELFSPQFLLERPLLRALRDDGGKPKVLLVDELDRSDEEFEAFLLEVLEVGVIPVVEAARLAQSPDVLRQVGGE